MEELAIRDADVVDGSGAPSYRADVVIDGGRIVSIVKEAADAGCQRPEARREVDADGLVLSPGFIDMHAHSDLALLRDPDHSAKAAQGVTLEVLGQDGLSYAPVDDRTLAEVRRAITGWNGYGDDIDFDWRSVGGYLDRLDFGFEGRGIAVNAAYLIPQGTVRMLAVGWEDREATPQELDRMRQLVAEGMEQGAVGMSSGLTYTPGMYAKDAELTELCKVVARYDGYYCPHHRSYGAGALEAYEEMVALTREAGCSLHLAHATMNFGVNKDRAPGGTTAPAGPGAGPRGVPGRSGPLRSGDGGGGGDVRASPHASDGHPARPRRRPVRHRGRPSDGRTGGAGGPS
jgi:N-acyl-D-amino-acid deacylase